MKRFIFSTIALSMLATTAAAHEVTEGTIMLMGDSNLEYASSEVTSNGAKVETDTVNLNFNGVYFVRNNFGIGLMLGYEDSEVKDGLVTETMSMSMFGPIVGYNFSLDHNTSLILHAGVFTASGDMNDGLGTSGDIDGEGYALGASFNFFVNDNLAVTLGVRRVDADLDTDIAGFPTVSADLTETATTVGLATFF